MGFLHTFLKQNLVYWAPASADDYGKPTLAAPVQLPCRWNDGESDIIDSKGDRVASSASVYTQVKLVDKGVIFLGKLTDLPSTIPSDPKTIPGVWEVKNVKTTPAVNARDLVYQSFV